MAYNSHGGTDINNSQILANDCVTPSSGDNILEDFEQIIQINGRKELVPPDNWIGPPPSSACELFIKRIPKDLNEHALLRQLARFGRIYDFRLPIDFNQDSRGYAYVKYTNEDDAACAMEVLEFYFVGVKHNLEVLRSYEKCQLFVSNIPKELKENEINEKLRQIFPNMERIFTRGKDDDTDTNGVLGFGNRGHVFVHFQNHTDALEAKKKITPGLIRMWGRDLKIVWANTDRETNKSKDVSFPKLV